MANLGLLFRCIGEAVCAKGLKALMSLVPMGDAVFEIAHDTYERLRRNAREQEQLAAIAAAAQATLEETRQEAIAVVRDLAAKEDLPPEAQANLVSYLMQVPSAVRQTMKRPSDPAGKTVPGSFTLKQADQLVTMLPTRLPSFKPGDRPPGVGNWELVELLGAGGFGEVWLARHPSLHGLTAALKFCLDDQAASALKHEASLLSQVMQQSKHPGIVTLRQAYLDSKPLCLEYEYINGGDLAALAAEWQRSGKTPRKQVNALVQRLAEIVAHAHKLTPPIVHRDLKPANILIERTSDGKVRLKVTDFGIGGIAATQSIQATKRGTTGQHQTMATSLRGAHTPLYASPQQIRGENPDPRDDVHALGVIWYQLLSADLTGGVPSDWMTVLEDVGQEKELIALLGSCVTSRPEKRLANAGVLWERLEAILNAPAIPVVELADEEDEDDIPEATLAEEDEPRAPPTVRQFRQAQTQRPEPPRTQRPEPPRTQRAPAEAPRTQRAPAEERRDLVPPPPPPSRRDESPQPQPQPGNQLRRYSAPGVVVAELKRDLEQWLRGEGFRTQDLRTEDGGTLIQIEQEGGWRKFVGMSSALNIILRQRGDELTVEIGAGQWFDKAAAGVVSLFLLWPLAVTAAIGAWNQMQLPERVFSRVADLAGRRDERAALPPPAAPRPATAGMSADAIAQLRELASLRDAGVLTDEEFQEQKSRLLGR